MNDITPYLSREDAQEMVDDALAMTALELKSKIADLRNVLYLVEDEILKRMQSRNARALLGEQYRIKSTIKRDITWDQQKLKEAQEIAIQEQVAGEFWKAFPTKFDCSLRGLKALENYGGKTWEAVQAAKEREAEKMSFTYEPL